MRLFILYSNIEKRIEIKNNPISKLTGENYLLWGADYYSEKGIEVFDNLSEKYLLNKREKQINQKITNCWTKLGGYGGDWVTIWKARKELNKVDVVFSAADRLGIPLMFFMLLGLIKRKRVVYQSIGLPERIEKLTTMIMKSLYIKAYSKIDTLFCYGYYEKEYLQEWIGKQVKVELVPLGLDCNCYVPQKEVINYDIISVGADPMRDYELLFLYAKKNKDLKIKMIISSELYATFKEIPENIDISIDIDFEAIKEFFNKSKIVVLPVKENNYSAATTTLLIGMALGKAVVVANTSAIKDGYKLSDGTNCLLYLPGDYNSFSSKVDDVLKDDILRISIESNSRDLSVNHLNKESYCRTIFSFINAN
ncbi:MAG: glycosyltransferase [Bacteroidota bacterium]